MYGIELIIYCSKLLVEIGTHLGGSLSQQTELSSFVSDISILILDHLWPIAASSRLQVAEISDGTTGNTADYPPNQHPFSDSSNGWAASYGKSDRTA